jgi:hypothetical protein
MTDPFDACRAAYEQGQRDAIAAAVQRVEAYQYISTIGVKLSYVVPKATVIALIKVDTDA